MGRPARISKEQILLAARRLLRDGVDSLSMRQLAAELGTVPTALYNHYESKEALINAVAEISLVEILLQLDESRPWHDNVRTWLLDTRQRLRDAPELLIFVDYASAFHVVLKTLLQLANLLQQGGFAQQEAFRQAQSLLWVATSFAYYDIQMRDSRRNQRYSNIYIDKSYRELAAGMTISDCEELWQSTVNREINGLLALANGKKS